ncbi:MAG: hypothetical protein H7235_11130, partial [Bdellovibrionaceae bacterium]|nr:hypothetical protein [Pseudobdellovibrionaceae bacterium]
MKHFVISILTISAIALNSFATVTPPVQRPVAAPTAQPAVTTTPAQPAVASPVWSLPTYREYKNELKEKKLLAQGLKVQDGLLYDIKTTPLTPVLLGKLKVIEAKYAFEWNDKEFHDSYLAAGNFSKEFMKDILTDPGQAAGKGFYFSFDPADSSSYGDSLTVFQPKSPIVALEYDPTIATLVGSDTAFVQRLSEAGVHGLRYQGYQQTWISIINAEALQKPQNLPAVLFHLFAKDQNYKRIIANYAYPEIFESYITPEDFDPIMYKVIKHMELTADDFTQVNSIGQITSLPLLNYIVKYFYKLFDQATTQVDKVKLLAGFQRIYVDPTVLAQFQKSDLTALVNDTQKKYQEILNVFDLATINQRKKSKNFVSALYKYSHDYQIRKDKALASVAANSNMDLLEYMKMVKGPAITYRDTDITETRNLGNLKYTLNSNGLLDSMDIVANDPNQAPMASTTAKITYTNLERLRLLESVMPNFSKELEDYYSVTPFDPGSLAAKATLSHGLKELVIRITSANSFISLQLAATPTRPATYVSTYNSMSKFSALVTAHPFN